MKITCNVITDLIPLYVDQVLSNDSKICVEEHIRECASCRDLVRQMEPFRQPDSGETGNSGIHSGTYPAEEKKTLKKLKHRIRNRIIGIAAVAAAAVFLITLAGEQYYYFHRTGLSYENSGLYVKNDKLYSDTTIEGGRLQTVISPDQTVWFINCSETAYARREYPAKEETVLIYDFNNLWTGEDEDTGTAVDPKLRKIYYISSDQIRDITDAWDETDPNQAEQMIQEAEQNAQLIWER